jgi:hypothetical protein
MKKRTKEQQELINIKRRKTLLERYGSETYNNMEQNLKTKERKYGDKNYNNKHKAKQTNIEKYGIENYGCFGSKEFKKRLNKKYGVNHPSKINTHKEKCRKKYNNLTDIEKVELKEKQRNTMVEKYGGRTFESKILSKKARKTMKKKYGNEHALQNTDFIIKQHKSGYNKKTFLLPSGQTINLQGYEPQALSYLLTKFNEEDIVTNYIDMENYIGILTYEYKGKTHRYFPDIYVKSINTIYEVKSEYTILDKRNKYKETSVPKTFNYSYLVCNNGGIKYENKIN